MTESTTDRLHKEITLRGSVSRVWRALTDSAEFGEWFDARPKHRRAEAFRMNDRGWSGQVENIKSHVDG